MSREVLERFIQSIAYPDEVSLDTPVVTLRVDDSEVTVRELGERLIFIYDLACSPEDVPTFAGYAFGRLLREQAVLAWDPRSRRLVLWQSVPQSASPDEMRSSFEAFLDSREWWQRRVAETHIPSVSFPETVIRP